MCPALTLSIAFILRNGREEVWVAKKVCARKQYRLHLLPIWWTASLTLFYWIFCFAFSITSFKKVFFGPPAQGIIIMFLWSKLVMKKWTHSTRGYCWGPTLPKVLKKPLHWYKKMCFRYIVKDRRSWSLGEAVCKEASSTHTSSEGASRGR
jgi:hypothetical protein